jgi:hypothetical protein
MSGEGFTVRIPPVTAGGFSKIILYAAIAVLLIMIVLISLHYTSFGIFSLDPTSGATITLPLSPTQTNNSYSTSVIPPYLSTRFSNVRQIRYTVSFDVFISNSLPTGYNQVIFYNGKQIRDPAVQACSPPAIVAPSCDPNLGKFLTKDTADEAKSIRVTPTSLESIQSGLFQNSGNICMYLSPDRNDLNLMYYVAGTLWNTNADPTVIGSTWTPADKVWTSGSRGTDGSWGSDGSGSWGWGSEGSGKWKSNYGPNCGSGGTIRYGDNSYECQSADTANGWVRTTGKGSTKTITVENVPLNTPFRVTLAVDPNFIEIYMNGDLVVTAKTPDASELYVYPSDGASSINFMGPPDFSPYCKVGNISYWNQVLPAKSIRLYSSNPANKKIFEQS